VIRPEIPPKNQQTACIDNVLAGFLGETYPKMVAMKHPVTSDHLWYRSILVKSLNGDWLLRPTEATRKGMNNNGRNNKFSILES